MMKDKNAKISIKELREHLKGHSKQELTDLLVESFKMSKEFQSYLSTKMKEDDGAQEHADIISFGAASKWMKIPQADRDMLLNNVFCGHCSDVVTIVDYTIEPDKFGIVLKGKCKNCGHEVARLVEMES